MPPTYDKLAKINNDPQGISSLEAQAINISGGNNPKNVSDKRKTE
jgi:hypothetical protein